MSDAQARGRDSPEPGGALNLGRASPWNLLFGGERAAPDLRTLCRAGYADGTYAEFWLDEPDRHPPISRPVFSLEWQFIGPGAGPLPWPAWRVADLGDAQTRAPPAPEGI